MASSASSCPAGTLNGYLGEGGAFLRASMESNRGKLGVICRKQKKEILINLTAFI